jgi:hypothetical protein
MFGGRETAEVERILSTALTASLRVSAVDRPVFIAQHLLGGELPVQPSEHPEKPADIDEEIMDLAELLKSAVNSAARYPDEPIRRIADHILRQVGDHGLAFGTDQFQEQPSSPSSPAYRFLGPPSPPQVEQKRQTVPAQAQGANPMHRAMQERISAKRQVPAVLGNRASAVLPSVVGAFEEQAARRMARHVDEGVVNQALRAGQQAQAAPGSRSSMR